MGATSEPGAGRAMVWVMTGQVFAIDGGILMLR